MRIIFQRHGRKERVWTGNFFLGGNQGRYSTICKHGWSLRAQHRLSLAPLLAGIPKVRHKSSAILPERCSVSWQRLPVRASRCPWLVLRAPRTQSEGALLRHSSNVSSVPLTAPWVLTVPGQDQGLSTQFPNGCGSGIHWAQDPIHKLWQMPS